MKSCRIRPHLKAANLCQYINGILQEYERRTKSVTFIYSPFVMKQGCVEGAQVTLAPQNGYTKMNLKECYTGVIGAGALSITGNSNRRED